MAMWTPEEVDPEFELTPMIDVVFLLIAFFMTLISFISAELVQLELPEAEQATIPEEPGERQYISVDAEGQLFLGATPITPEALTAQLTALKAEIPQIQVFLRADAHTAHRHVNRVMEATAKAGIFDLIFASAKD
ncbi:biopolymer transporter ExbD [Coraliomargarita algicola]|uniref:Biopolymer transporter ExbD n=1 Tax=Coraliomargarita algicola TaxID=3092156 RepID=A0ABZ0RJU9_9BACT|nr:biopolymer transporter ExbD [Coraliomargarita sp. J2-16]WPJ95451.1 biopolymer transporter ExbD [Coraliomargarita sp. J2-16]